LINFIKLFWAVIESGYCQFVDLATRGNNVQDVFLSDNDGIVKQIRPNAPLGNSDHSCVEFDIALVVNAHPACHDLHKRYFWHSAAYDSVQSFLDSISWYGVDTYSPDVVVP
jgi:hypothetical protein